jgi:hypothetical protein
MDRPTNPRNSQRNVFCLNCRGEDTWNQKTWGTASEQKAGPLLMPLVANRIKDMNGMMGKSPAPETFT